MVKKLNYTFVVWFSCSGKPNVIVPLNILPITLETFCLLNLYMLQISILTIQFTVLHTELWMSATRLNFILYFYIILLTWIGIFFTKSIWHKWKMFCWLIFVFKLYVIHIFTLCSIYLTLICFYIRFMLFWQLIQFTMILRF